MTNSPSSAININMKFQNINMKFSEFYYSGSVMDQKLHGAQTYSIPCLQSSRHVIFTFTNINLLKNKYLLILNAFQSSYKISDKFTTNCNAKGTTNKQAIFYSSAAIYQRKHLYSQTHLLERKNLKIAMAFVLSCEI